MAEAKKEFYEIEKMVEFNNSRLILLAGRPSMGISTTALNISKNIATKGNGTVLFYSLELSKTSCLNKLKEEIENLIICDIPAITIEEIIKRSKSIKNLSLIVIDYEALINTKKDLKGIEKTEYIRKALKKLSKELNVAILVATILNKVPDVRFEVGEEPRPRIEDFNTDISDFDTILLLYRENYYYKNTKNNTLEINVVKNNNGKLGIINVNELSFLPKQNPIIQYTLEKYTDKFFDFVYDVKKISYKNYVIDCWGTWNEEVQREYYNKFIEKEKNNTYIIKVNNENIGFYNGKLLENGNYEIGNICIIPKFQRKGIGTRILQDIIEKYKFRNIEIQYFKQNPVGTLYKRLGFRKNDETEFHYKMIKYKQVTVKKYNAQEDYERVINFLTNQYETNKNMVCWLPERFDDLVFRIDTLYHEERGKEKSADYIYIYEVQSEIVGLILPDGDSFNSCIKNGYEYIFGQMLDLAETELQSLFEEDDNGTINFLVVSHDSLKYQADELIKRGYKKNQAGDYDNVQLPMQTNYVIELPKGYKLVYGESVPEIVKKRVCHYGFHPIDDDGNLYKEYTEGDFAYNARKSSKYYKESFETLIMAEDGDYCCYSFCYVDKKTNTAFIEPVSTRVKYRMKGLAKQMLHGAVNRCKELGIEKVFINSFDWRVKVYNSSGFETIDSIGFWYKIIPKVFTTK